MDIKDFYSEEKDILGEPQIIEGIPFYPIKLFERDKSNTMQMLFGRDKMEFIQKGKMPFEGIKNIYKSSYLKSMIYAYGYESINNYYGIIQILQDYFVDTCHIDINVDGDGVAIIGNTQLNNPIDIFNSPFYIVIRKGSCILKIDEDVFDVIRECVLRQNGISLKNIEGYNADMEKIKKDKIRSQKSISFSDEIFAFISMAGLDIYNEGLRNYTLYQFKYHFGYLQQYINYKTLYPLQASGMVKFKSGGIKYYLEPLDFEKGRYDDLLVKADEFAESGIAKSVDSFKIPDLKNNK